MKTHWPRYAALSSWHRTACGIVLEAAYCTLDKEKVTCLICKKRLGKEVQT